MYVEIDFFYINKILKDEKDLILLILSAQVKSVSLSQVSEVNFDIVVKKVRDLVRDRVLDFKEIPNRTKNFNKNNMIQKDTQDISHLFRLNKKRVEVV